MTTEATHAQRPIKIPGITPNPAICPKNQRNIPVPTEHPARMGGMYANDCGPATYFRIGDRSILASSIDRSEEHTSELQSLMRTSYAVFCLKKNTTNHTITVTPIQ